MLPQKSHYYYSVHPFAAIPSSNVSNDRDRDPPRSRLNDKQRPPLTGNPATTTTTRNTTLTGAGASPSPSGLPPAPQRSNTAATNKTRSKQPEKTYSPRAAYLAVPPTSTPPQTFSPDLAASPGVVSPGSSRPASPSGSGSIGATSAGPAVSPIPRTPSIGRLDPFARVFPLPPPSGAPTPTIRPGSVRSVSFERSGAGESPDDDRASRRSNRSQQPSVVMTPGRPPLPPLPTEGLLNSDAKPSSSKAPRKRSEELELHEAADRVAALTSESGVMGSFDKRLNRSVMGGSKAKLADEKAAGADNTDPQPRLACLYLVSGLGKDPTQWALSDKDATVGVQPLEDSLSVFWRPDMLGSTFSGEKSEDWGKKGNQRSMNNSARRDVTTRSVPGTGPEGPSRLVARTMKYAHPKDVEVVNSTLAPATTCHTFTFNVPRQSTLNAMASRRSGYESTYNTYEPPGTVPPAGQEQLRGTTSASDLVFYGVTLTVWSHADKDRSEKLKQLKRRVRVDSALSESMRGERARRRNKTPWMPMNMNGRRGAAGTASDYTASDTGMSDSDLETTFTATDVDHSIGDMGTAYDENCDVFWLPYALTLVSRYPVYDVMQDYLRLSWARYSKDARSHMRQIFNLLNSEAPRPGDLFRLPIGLTPEDEVSIEAVMPGALDFDKGTIKVDFQLWPLFQALDIDHILTCIEVALSNSGRIIFCSRHPAMLGAAVETLKYIVELRGWSGIALPNIHARDTTFLIEDPGPYIIGMATECRYIITTPPDVVVVDLDMNSLACKSFPPNVVTPRQKREKVRVKLQAALGVNFPVERSVPTEYRVSFPKGSFRNIHQVYHGPSRPRYLSERLVTPIWWNQSAVIAVFDKIMADKHKRPSLFQRITKSGFVRAQEQLTVNERLAKAMMRKRALHYVEKRDDFELKVARITRRLQKLVQEGEQWKHRFETFEKYAERLSREAEDLKGKIDKEQREARRLSNLNSEREQQNADLQDKLAQTEGARAEAMRQLSDMHHSIQELERERNAIMDVIELQITNALQGLPLLDLDDSVSDRTHNGSESQPTSPKTISSTIGSVRRSKRTPHTRDSTQTTFSVDTHNTNRTTMSVIGQLTDGSLRRGGSILDIDQISTADRMLNKSGSISERVALIQAKLELALAPVTSSADTTSEGTAGVSSADTSSDAIPNVKETPPSRTVSPEPRTTVAVIAPSDDGSAGEDGDLSGTDADDHRYRHGHHHSHHHHHGHSHGHHSPHHHHSAPPVSIVKPRPHAHRAVVLRPPPRRVTQRKSYESVDLTPSSAPNTPRTHAKTGSLTPREIILTPVESPDSPIRRPRDSQHHTNVDDRPASVISTTAFGI